MFFGDCTNQFPFTINSWGQIPYSYGLGTQGFPGNVFNPYGLGTQNITGNVFHPYGFGTQNLTGNMFNPNLGMFVGRVPQTIGNVNQITGHPFMLGTNVPFVNPFLAHTGLVNNLGFNYGITPYTVPTWPNTVSGFQGSFCR